MPLPTFYPDDSEFEYRLRKHRKSSGYEASVCRRRKGKQLRKTATRKPHRKWKQCVPSRVGYKPAVSG
ncbi:uncharacterized protein FPRO_15877 [Fusarium proliferatum ET1]|uniref:Uncharacterized protein n=1 Tax=Fusarium proliferatum (strain ET1) TaxID=1227346 RepID=A0A1L7WA82_FUSPR|nr:uncharacterized protein FPRO_15877 [Fusarium proliferatum ET1]CZR49518.1 uncharacterized protein FPRO_15877 [Fusarium proliferatum ET1]